MQDNPYHKRHGNGFLRCLPRRCLWALPSPLASLEAVCDSQEEIFKGKKGEHDIRGYLSVEGENKKGMAGAEGEGKE